MAFHLKLKAYAKINLGLRILGKRADGYHNIETVLQSISLADELLLEPRGDGIILEVVPDLGIPSEENLVYRAAQLILKRASRHEGVHIRLLKRIPPAAGLGGASSDAAATLVGINELFHLNLEKEELKMLGLELGSDVPFFFEGGLCRATGRGEILSKLASSILDIFIMLLKPPCTLRTADVYAEFDRIGAGEMPPAGQRLRLHFSYDLIHAIIRPPRRWWGRPLRSVHMEPRKVNGGGFEYELDFTNDLERAAWRLCPELEDYRAFLEGWQARAQHPLFFGMSGSGPTYYAISWAWADELKRLAAGHWYRSKPHSSELFRWESELTRFMEETKQLGAQVFWCRPTQVGHETLKDYEDRH